MPADTKDLESRVDDLSYDVKVIRKQLDAVRADIREMPRLVGEAIRDSERRVILAVNMSFSEALAEAAAIAPIRRVMLSTF